MKQQDKFVLAYKLAGYESLDHNTRLKLTKQYTAKYSGKTLEVLIYDKQKNSGVLHG